MKTKALISLWVCLSLLLTSSCPAMPPEAAGGPEVSIAVAPQQEDAPSDGDAPHSGGFPLSPEAIGVLNRLMFVAVIASDQNGLMQNLNPMQKSSVYTGVILFPDILALAKWAVPKCASGVARTWRYLRRRRVRALSGPPSAYSNAHHFP